MKKPNETKKGPLHTNGEGQGRITAETVVTDGPNGIERFRGLTRAILAIDEPASAQEVAETVVESADRLGKLPEP